MAGIFTDWGKSKKPIFGEGKPLTYSSVREAKSAYRTSVKTEKAKVKAKKTRAKAQKSRSERWKKSYKFSRKSPIAKRLRKLI